jgi:GH24 family phage-related lysozyme (muramidase)
MKDQSKFVLSLVLGGFLLTGYLSTWAGAPPGSDRLFHAIARWENAPLASRPGHAVETRRWDALGGVSEIGYGFTAGAIATAREVGILRGPFAYPAATDKASCDRFLRYVVIPTYREVVRREVRVPLTGHQEDALVLFSLNLGRGALRRLLARPGRLHDGNPGAMPAAMRLYNRAGGKVVRGLVRRRDYEARLWAGGWGAVPVNF